MNLETLTLASTTSIVCSGASLLAGWYLIRWKRHMPGHRACMLVATSFAGLFLVFYVTRWALFGSKSFEGTGWWRVFYFVNLVPHVLMAMTVGPLAGYLIYLAMRRRDFKTHKRIARITLPIWLYVAGSGWLIYFLLYKVNF